MVVALSLLLALPTFVLRPSATGYKLSGFMHPRCARHNPFRLAASDEHDDNLSDEDTEELLFQFDSAGKPKAWVLQPHLRNMVEDLKNGATLLDVRPLSAWKAGHLPAAEHVPLDQLRQEARLSEPAPDDRKVYVHASFEREFEAVEAASLLRAAGYTGVMALDESYEALRAQCLAALRDLDVE